MPVFHWNEPEENCYRVDIDYAAPCQTHFLMLVDVKSNFERSNLGKNHCIQYF